MNFYRITYKNHNNREFDVEFSGYNKTDVNNKVKFHFANIKIIKTVKL